MKTDEEDLEKDSITIDGPLKDIDQMKTEEEIERRIRNEELRRNQLPTEKKFHQQDLCETIIIALNWVLRDEQMKTEQAIKNTIRDLKQLRGTTPYKQQFSQDDIIDAKIIALEFVLERGEI